MGFYTRLCLLIIDLVKCLYCIHPFHNSPILYSKFELIHFDICGLLSIASIHNHKYVFLTIIYDHTRFVWIVLLKTKYEIYAQLLNFITVIGNQHNITPKMIRIDNGPRFMLSQFYASKGIKYKISCIEIPHQNKMVERKHQHFLNVGRELLYEAKLSKYYWSYATMYATFIIKRVPT